MARSSLALDSCWRDYYAMWNPFVEPLHAPSVSPSGGWRIVFYARGLGDPWGHVCWHTVGCGGHGLPSALKVDYGLDAAGRKKRNRECGRLNGKCSICRGSRRVFNPHGRDPRCQCSKPVVR